MSHDVFLCYDDKDLNIANKICKALEKNKIDCWFKKRDVKGIDDIEEIMQAIGESKVMVLIFSENSKHSNFVNTEANIAFDDKKQIFVYKIDNSKIDGGLDLFINNQQTIDAQRNPENRFDELVDSVSEAVGISFFKKFKIPIIVLVAIILIAAVGIFALQPLGDGNMQSDDAQIVPGDVKLKITDFHVDDVRKESSSWNFSYFVGGTISPEPTSQNCKIIVDFYDKTGNIVDSTETVFSDAQKISNGFVFGSSVSDKNDIKRVDVQLVTENNIIIAQDDSQIK